MNACLYKGQDLVRRITDDRGDFWIFREWSLENGNFVTKFHEKKKELYVSYCYKDKDFQENFQ